MNLFEVFEEVRVKPELEGMFREVEVVKVTASRSSGKTVIHLKSRHLLGYRNLEDMEQALTTQFFGRVGQKVELSVEYQLSGQYNPKSLWNLYTASVIEEIGKESRMASFLLKNATIEFDMQTEPMVMRLDAEDTFVNRTLGEEIKDFLKEMYEKRFGFMVSVLFTYHEPVEKKKKREPETYTVETVAKTSVAEPKVKEQGKRDAAAVPQKKSEEKVTSAANKPNIGGFAGKTDLKEKKDFSKFVKKKLPEDPDIFYGRAFDGEITPLCDIQDEIGEVVVYGKILSCEETAMKNGEKLIVKFNFTDFTDTISGKLFIRNEDWDEIKGNLKGGKCIRLKGNALYDRYDKVISISSIVGIKNIPDFVKKRKDTCEEKAKKRFEAMHVKIKELIDSI